MTRKRRKGYSRLRMDSGHHRRIRLTAMLFGVLLFVPVALRLYYLMVDRYDYYAEKALRNQTRTTVVAADRGKIYDRNMNILADSQSVENVYLDPHELKQSGADIPAISQKMAQILELDAQWIEKQAADRKMRYKLLKSGVSLEIAGQIRSYINENKISGIHLEPSSKRTYR